VSKYQRLSGYELLLKRAQEHKDNPTSSEQKLLTALTRDLPNLEFQFQVVMVPFIVDFVSLRKKVIIEVDGKSHVGNLDSDETRQRDLERDGYSFLRFSHNEVLNSIDQVVSIVRKFCALSYGQRRKFSSPQAEYIQKGMVPRVIGDQDPFEGLHTKVELEDILSNVDPYDLLDEHQAGMQVVLNKTEDIMCSSCNCNILTSEPRFREHSTSGPGKWVHKKCR
jgi:very-short-patch-repair endonuclease